jgi:predicted DNA-binding transcriptional regulator YafY
MPFAARAERALAKIEGALPPERLRELRRLLRRVLIGEPAELAKGDVPGAVDPSLLAVFERAFTRSVVLKFDYLDRHGRLSSRTVEPHALLVRAPLWYVIAWDRDKDAARLFRMDRIREVRTVEGEHFGGRPLELVAGICPDAKATSGRQAVSAAS